MRVKCLAVALPMVWCYSFLGQEKIVYPQFLESDSWVSVLRIANLDDSRVMIPATFRRSDGSAWAHLDLFLRNGGSAETSLAGGFEFRVGGVGAVEWLTFEPGQPGTSSGYIVLDAEPSNVHVSGFLEYRPDGSLTGTPTAKVGVQPAPRATWISGVFDRDTAIWLANIGPAAIDVKVHLAARFEETLAVVRIPPRQSKALFMRELSLIEPDFYGDFYPLLLSFPPSGVFSSVPVSVRSSAGQQVELWLIEPQRIEFGGGTSGIAFLAGGGADTVAQFRIPEGLSSMTLTVNPSHRRKEDSGPDLATWKRISSWHAGRIPALVGLNLRRLFDDLHIRCLLLKVNAVELCLRLGYNDG